MEGDVGRSHSSPGTPLNEPVFIDSGLDLPPVNRHHTKRAPNKEPSEMDDSLDVVRSVQGGSGCGLNIELADAVAAIRGELLEAAERGAGEDIAFTVGPIEMEFTVELRADAKAKAGFKAWVLDSEVEAGVSRGRTHRVMLTLTPKGPDGGDLFIAGKPDGASGPGDLSEHVGR
jgi:hypothetical protein